MNNQKKPLSKVPIISVVPTRKKATSRSVVVARKPTEIVTALRKLSYSQLDASRILFTSILADQTNGDKSDMYDLANAHYSAGNYKKAISVAKKFGNIPKFILIIALCHSRLKCWESLLEATCLSCSNNCIRAQLLFLRGWAYFNSNNFFLAKQEFINSLKSDVTCYDSLQQLLENNMLTGTQEQELLSSLDFSQAGDLSELLKSLYQAKIKKYDQQSKLEPLLSKIEKDYNLSECMEISIARAESLFALSRFKRCLEITSLLMIKDSFSNLNLLQIHISCLLEQSEKQLLFNLAHQLVDLMPQKAVAWFAVGSYYMLVKNYEEARRYFHKAGSINPQYGPAWIGYGHTFALQSEHDQAIVAYSTAIKYGKGLHRPKMYIGIQYFQLGNLVLAKEFLDAARSICKTDALLENELGVYYYHSKDYTQAKSFFLSALRVSGGSNMQSEKWVETWVNLGHVSRKLGELDDSRRYFSMVLSVEPKNAQAFAALGLISHLKGELDDAILKYHQALAIAPSDTSTLEILDRALREVTESKMKNYVLVHETKRQLSISDRLPSNIDISAVNYAPSEMIAYSEKVYNERRSAFEDAIQDSDIQQQSDEDVSMELDDDDDDVEVDEVISSPLPIMRRSTRLMKRTSPVQQQSRSQDQTPRQSPRAGSISGPRSSTRSSTPRQSPRLSMVRESVGPRTRGRIGRRMDFDSDEEESMEMNSD